MNNYHLVKELSDGLVILSHYKYGEQMWSKCICRKHKLCEVTNIDLYKQEAYLPITNGYNRADRIAATIINDWKFAKMLKRISQ